MTDKELILGALSFLKQKGEQTDILLDHWKDLDDDSRTRIKIKLYKNNFITVAPYSPYHFIIRTEGEEILLHPEKLDDDDGNIITKKKLKLELGHKIALFLGIPGIIVLFFGNDLIGRFRKTDDSKTHAVVNSDTAKPNIHINQALQINSNNGDVNNEFIGRDKITNTKTVVVQNNSTAESPTLIMSTISGASGLTLSEDKKRFTFTLYSQSATSKSINLFASFAYTNNFEDLKYYISDGNLRLVNDLSIPKNYESSKYILLDSSIHYDYLVMWCRGNYQDGDLKKTFEYNEVVLFSFKTNSTSFLTGDLTIKVKDWMTKKETRH